MNLEFSREIFEKYSNTKFQENPPWRSRIAPFGRMDREADMTKQIATFRNFSNEPKKPNRMTLMDTALTQCGKAVSEGNINEQSRLIGKTK